MLTMKNLSASVADKTIINGLDLTLEPGKVHAIMGPNGSGKSTLSAVLAGDPSYSYQADVLELDGQDMTSMSAEERSHAGLFIGYQHPIAIPGVNNMVFLKAVINQQRKAKGLDEFDAYDIIKMIKTEAAQVGLPESFLQRDLNDEFSGGERKRNEILQMRLLDPSCIILDEIDSGLDVDALGAIAKAVNEKRSANKSFLLITHYQRLLNHITPDYVHIMAQGRIVHSGGPELAEKIEQQGYGWLNSETQESS